MSIDNHRKDFKVIEESFKNDPRGYTLLSTIEDYQNNTTKLKFICPRHPDKVLQITWTSYQQGAGCQYCGIEARASKRRLSREYIAQFLDGRGYSLLTKEYKNSCQKLQYVCKNHPDKTLTTNWLLEYVPSYTDTKGIDCQVSFPDLKDTAPLTYDFYLKDLNLLIEYQGNFHNGSLVEKRMQTQESYELQLKHDKMKQDYAHKHQMRLLEIFPQDSISHVLSQNITAGFI